MVSCITQYEKHEKNIKQNLKHAREQFNLHLHDYLSVQPNLTLTVS